MGKRKYHYTRSQTRYTDDGLLLLRILIEYYRGTYLAYYLSHCIITKRIKKLPKQRLYRPLYSGTSLPAAQTLGGGSLFCDPLCSTEIYEIGPNWVFQRGTGVLTPQGRMAIPEGGCAERFPNKTNA